MGDEDSGHENDENVPPLPSYIIRCALELHNNSTTVEVVYMKRKTKNKTLMFQQQRTKSGKMVQ